MNFSSFIIRSVFLSVCCISGVWGSSDSLRAEGSEKGYPSFYLAGMKIDGKAPEWPSRTFYDILDAKVLYAVGNDKDHIYFCLQVLEQPGQMTLIHDGLMFWVDPRGKRKEKFLVRLSFKPPLPEGGSPAGDRLQGTGPGIKPGQNEGYLHGRPQNLNPRQGPGRFQCFMETSGFPENYNGKQPLGRDNKGFDAALAYDSTGVLTLEVQLPIQAFSSEALNAKNLSLGFLISKSAGGPGEGPSQGGMQGSGRPGGGPGGGGMDGGNPGGMGGSGGMGGPGGMDGGMPGGGGSYGGGPGGGGMHGHPGGGMQGGGPPVNSSSSNQNKTSKVWHKFNLAPGP